MTRKTWLAAGTASALLIALLGSALYASPWWTVHQLKQAARERDVDAVLARVDQAALRASVRLAMGFRLAETAGNGADAKGAGTMVDSIADTLTSSTLLMTMLLQGHPSAAMNRAAPLVPVPPEPAAGDWTTELRYLDRSNVEVRAADTPDAGAFILHRKGLVDWKLSGLKLPEAIP